MLRIHQFPLSVVSMIAADEVNEGPASVVKQRKAPRNSAPQPVVPQSPSPLLLGRPEHLGRLFASGFRA